GILKVKFDEEQNPFEGQNTHLILENALPEDASTQNNTYLLVDADLKKKIAGDLLGVFELEVEQEDEQVEKDPFAASLEVTTLPPVAATESTHNGVEGFEGDYGGIEFSKDGSTLREDFEGINQAWGGGLDASEFVDSNKVVKPDLCGLELLETTDRENFF
ncbi:hypothetical protein Tco_1464614, partial [Tanacetum coccineum]